MDNIMNVSLDDMLANEIQIVKLNDFLTEWESAYLNQINTIPLFCVEKTNHWSNQQKIYFVKLFYHVRGHFNKFLWLLGNFAPNHEIKKKILENIAEEFGTDISHEELYLDFANCMGANLSKELTEEESYLPFIQQFNKGHIEWLVKNDWDNRWAAFSAYEKLDNIDYGKLLSLAISLDTPKEGQIFFKIHNNANHFEKTSDELINIWIKNSKKIKAAFMFIANHQIKMWQQLSDSIFHM
jgi:hypothetical protein